ncbi:hypothetical protein EDB92DRAFT_2104321 [Lactarius akahatsu]|uniref:Uncharacterized protein n=1 Tax=Lactarius akahatsu TaxID=416441 RepID=A0AAD4Q761_9AGAM|nr:hypothetical protein EDB92DRAFT_2104321 [Lactarius akahatsu]
MATLVPNRMCGSGSHPEWVNNYPEVRDRGVHVFACDISVGKFPQGDKPDVDKVAFFQHDVTKPFPDDILGTFGLRVLGADGTSLVFTHENPPPLEGQELDIVAYTQGKSTLATINRICSCWAIRQGLVVGYARTSIYLSVPRRGSSDHSLSYHLRKMLQDAPFQILSSTRALAPHGEYCASHKGPNGTSISGYTAFSLQNFSQVTNVLTSAMMEAGGLEFGDGTRSDEDERQVLMKELRDFAKGGVLLLMFEWVVLRPRPLGY